jgi:hypothetical protein
MPAGQNSRFASFKYALIICPIGNGSEFAFRGSPLTATHFYFVLQSTGMSTPGTRSVARSALERVPGGSAYSGKSARRAELCFSGFLFSVSGRRVCGQRVQKVAGSGLYFLDRPQKSRFIGLRRTVESADLPHELARRGANLIVGHRRFKIEQGFDASTHNFKSSARPGLSVKKRTRCRSMRQGLGLAAPGRALLHSNNHALGDEIWSSTCRVDKKELNLTRRFLPPIGGDDGIAQKGFAIECGGHRSDETQGALVDQQPARS